MTDYRRRFRQLHRRLYCFADGLELCRALLAGGAPVVQLRNKTLPQSQLLELARRMADLLQAYPQALLIINDHLDIARQSGAHGVHLGQQDQCVAQALTQVPPGFIVGVSVETVAQAVAAEAAGATYLGAGAMFATPTKPEAPAIGPDTVKAIVAAVSIPVVVIGGITLATIREAVGTGASLFAVISDINQATDIAERIRRFNAVLQGATHE